MTTVVNIRKKKGKKSSFYDVYCGRGSLFGNPFKIGRDGDRKQVIQKFREYFYKRLTDVRFRDSVLSLKGKILGCYCKPLECHLDIIVEYLETKT
jgi:hypothetical protein